MEKNRINEMAFEHLVDTHCVMVDCREIKTNNQCPFDDYLTCEECWERYFVRGDWWNGFDEPDPDRKWKEMHGE